MRKITDKDVQALQTELQNNPLATIEGTIPEFISKFSIKSELDSAPLESIVGLMLHSWRDLKFSEKSLADMFFYTFNFSHIKYDMDDMEKLITGSDPYILDTGCNWGSLSLALSKHTKNLYAIDPVPGHATVTHMRVPGINSYCGDARDMDFPPDFFDVIIGRSVIEHVGDYTRPRGKVDRDNYADKLRYLQSLAHCLKVGGSVWISTGNYNAPYNGEIGNYMSHWLDGPQYEKYMNSINTIHDKYWLLTWDQIESLCAETGFEVAHVHDPAPSHYRQLKSHLVELGNPAIIGDLLEEQSRYDPHLMGGWVIHLRKVKNMKFKKGGILKKLRKIFRP